MRRRALILAAALAAAAAPQARAAEPRWQLEQPAPPPGAPFSVPLGTPGDLTFWAPNRGLLAVEGNSVVPRGILAWDGETWHTLSTVCGGPGDTMRIAWAGPDEFWTVSEPSRPRQGSGTALCHFRDGEVAGSYSTADNATDPYREMNAAACRAPDDCWFGGIGSRDPTGNRVGAFHLHWDGQALRTVYNGGSARGVTDIEATAEGFVESVVVGPRRGAAVAPDPPPLESNPALLHRIGGGVFTSDPFAPGTDADGGTELLALDSDGSELWAVGGGAASGPKVAQLEPDGTTRRYPDGVIPRAPLAARLVTGRFRELPLSGSFGPEDRLEDVAVVPGTDDAWAAVVPFADRGKTNVKARVALIDGATGTAEVQTLPASGSGRGAAARIAFTSATDGWMVTSAGWLYHYTDGTPQAKDADPLLQRTITFRPNESAEQFVPDTLPADDSQLFAPPPVAVDPEPTAQPEPKPLKALISNVKKPSLKGTTLTLRFTVARKAKVQLIASRKGKVVAKTKNRTFAKGTHSLSLKLSRKRWPTKLRFKTKELTIDTGESGSGGDDTVVTSPSDTVVTSTAGHD